MKGERNGNMPEFLHLERNTKELQTVLKHILISTKPVHLLRINGGEIHTTDPEKWIDYGAQYVGKANGKGI